MSVGKPLNYDESDSDDNKNGDGVGADHFRHTFTVKPFV